MVVVQVVVLVGHMLGGGVEEVGVKCVVVLLFFGLDLVISQGCVNEQFMMGRGKKKTLFTCSLLKK